MNKRSISKILYIISIILLILFIVFIIYDYKNYNPMITSAPFYLNIIVRLIEFILPSIITFVVGLVCDIKKLK